MVMEYSNRHQWAIGERVSVMSNDAFLELDCGGETLGEEMLVGSSNHWVKVMLIRLWKWKSSRDAIDVIMVE
ncbi:hypothetical protein Tco_1000968 [Tanacetum coccineum]|uniref:Uncharacterized protein n=1 Tax=Tanacetum coccineum TaxID=301880 RepID=A0ABQ5CHG3_9ASTR